MMANEQKMGAAREALNSILAEKEIAEYDQENQIGRQREEPIADQPAPRPGRSEQRMIALYAEMNATIYSMLGNIGLANILAAQRVRAYYITMLDRQVEQLKQTYEGSQESMGQLAEQELKIYEEIQKQRAKAYEQWLENEKLMEEQDPSYVQQAKQTTPWLK